MIRTEIAGVWEIRPDVAYLYPRRYKGYHFEIVDSHEGRAFISPIATPTGLAPTFKTACRMAKWVNLKHLVKT